MISVVRDPDPSDLEGGWGVSTCRDCGAPIVWAHTSRAKRIPVDLKPREGGRLELYIELFPDGSLVDPGVQRVRERPAERPEASPAWWPHWATCKARRRPLRLVPRALVEQLRDLMGRKWGPLFSREGQA